MPAPTPTAARVAACPPLAYLPTGAHCHDCGDETPGTWLCDECSDETYRCAYCGSRFTDADQCAEVCPVMPLTHALPWPASYTVHADCVPEGWCLA